jgi:hypothetical protein
VIPSSKAVTRLLAAAGALILFLISIEAIRSAAGGIAPLLLAIRVEGIVNLFGLGWLAACGVLSGSPVAAVSLGLFGAGTINAVEALGMIAGSRFGAAFVVLFLGSLHYMRGNRNIITVAAGVLSLLVTWTIYIPATAISWFLVTRGWLTFLEPPEIGLLDGIQEAITKAVVGPAAAVLHPVVLFLGGVALLLGSFSIFDRALPELNPSQGRFRQIADIIYRPKVMFLLGIAVTCLTLSVSVSLGLLVPISARGYVRRENLIPYIMGANISTFVDTIFVAVLVGRPGAAAIVLSQIVSVSLVSLAVLVFFFRQYRYWIELALEAATRDRRSFFVFLVVMIAIPLVLLLL